MDRPARPRIVGIDVARGLAVLGMFAAHLGNKQDLLLPNDGSVLEAFDGRSAAGFALLAGISAALLSGGRHPSTGARLRHARVRVLARAVLLWPLGAAMIALNTPVMVILPTYALLFAVTAGLLSLRPRALLVAALVVAAVAPPLVLLARDAVYVDTQPVQIVDITIGHAYPAAIWIAYLMTGLAVGRLDLGDRTIRVRLLALGTAAATAGFVTNAVAMRTIDLSHTFWRELLTTRPHASSPVEVVSNVGVVLAVLALSLMLADRFPRAVAPLAATGALALTAYCGHLVAIWRLGTMVVWEPSNVRLLVFVVVTVAATWAWRSTLGRGPLELLLHRASTGIADLVVPAGRRVTVPAEPAAMDEPAEPHGPTDPNEPVLVVPE